jgi:hypothetical protein
MRWSDSARRLAVVAVAWVGASACSPADNSSGVASGVTVSDSNGIRIVRFAELGALELTERSTSVAAEAGRQGSELYQVSTARLLDSNRLAVGNSGTSEVLYFDQAGQLLHPAFSGLLLDADERIWIGAVDDLGAVDRAWTVLDSSGMPLFRIDLPASARPLDARGDRLVVLDRTDWDEEVLQWIELGTPE